MWKILVIFGLITGGVALNAQDVAPAVAVAPSGQRPPGILGIPTAAPELDTRGKAIYWWRHGFGIGVLSADVLVAGLNEANGTPPEWRGAAGFGKRLGDTVGSSSIASGIGFGLSAALHVDPRYYRCRTCGVWGHIGSAAKQSFVSHTDSGRLVPAIPELASIYGAGMISTAWYPGRYELLSDGVRRANYVMLWRFGFDLVREFAPRKARKFFRMTPNDVYDDQ